MHKELMGFDWDDGNEAKCQKHGLSQDEIETFFRHGDFWIAPDYKHSAKEKRLIARGQMPNGRLMFVSFVVRGRLIRPVSARYMHQKEWKRYDQKESPAL